MNQTDSKAGKSVQELLDTPMYYVECKKCNKPTYCFMVDPRGKKFHESKPYLPGQRPIPIPPDKAAAITRCPVCGRKIDPNVDFTIAVENKSIKSILKFYQAISNYVQGTIALSDGHLEILRYAHYLCVDTKEWERKQLIYDRIACDAKKLANMFGDRCIKFACGKSEVEADKPVKSKIIIPGLIVPNK